MTLRTRDLPTITVGAIFGLGALLAAFLVIHQSIRANWLTVAIGAAMVFLYAVLAVGYLQRGTAMLHLNTQSIRQPGPLGWTVDRREVESIRLAHKGSRSILLIQVAPQAANRRDIQRQLRWSRTTVRLRGVGDHTLQLPLAESSARTTDLVESWTADSEGRDR